ncbi:LytTR family DNA-binding domain-containing protein [Hyphomonas sp.]|uniref:LytTR family DNA-binding domain-containing protein n=1 Tax=Hyphomonas sp. TaxID=87 RepID=UPI00391C5D7F
MTSGDKTGTSGESVIPGPWTIIALLTIPVILVNATSDLIDMQRSGLTVHPAEPFIWELSSACVIVLLAPMVGLAVKRWPLLPGPGLPMALLVHSGLTIAFSLVHVAAMLPMRHLAYALAFDWPYNFFGGGVWITLLYEWRKDLLTYGIFVAIYTFHGWWIARQAAPGTVHMDARIEVRDGGRTLFLLPGDIFYLEAAGNYVNIVTVNGAHLVRGTLSDWDKRLSAIDPAAPALRFLRIHRSRIVNKAHITEIQPTASGDFELALANGDRLTGSRRFRAALG